MEKSKKNYLSLGKNSYQTVGKAFPFDTYWKKTFGLLALILYSENRQLESPENKQIKAHACMCKLFGLIADMALAVPQS